jgi:hypothetical protein
MLSGVIMSFRFGLLLPLAACLCASWSALAGPVTIYVSPAGDDRCSGARPEGDMAGNGPVATLSRALEKTRAARGKRRIVLRGGTYLLDQPLVLGPGDSGLVIAAYAGETPVISGESRITGWRCSTVNPNIWRAEVAGARGGSRVFHELFVNGWRRKRARLPISGFYRTADGLVPGHPDEMRFYLGDIEPQWAEAGDVELVALQAWAQTRNQIRAVLAESNLVVVAGAVSPNNTEPNGRFYIDNVPDWLRPGEWHLDRRTGEVEYWPEAGEDVPSAAITAPHLYELVLLEGTEREPVQDVVFRGLVFADADWRMEGGSDVDIQAAVETEAAVQARFARGCAVERCRFARLGGYAVDFGHGCQGNRVAGCEMSDLGGGGVRLGDSDANQAAAAPNVNNTVTDNHIHHIGLVNAPAVGVLVLLSGGNRIAHNEIDHTFYTTISAGWSWGYASNLCRSNIIEYNHLHDIGQGVLSDMGGVYTLGAQPGTIVRNNLIHDVNVSVYGGWGLYTDEGSSGIVLESNIVYHCQSAGFHQHYGQDNIVRDNIFALNRESQLARTRPEEHRSFIFTNNIVYFDSGQLMSGNWTGGMEMDHNIYFDRRTGPSHPPPDGVMNLEAWRALGRDRHSQFFDPLFVAPQKGDFRLRPDSPAIAFGFHPPDLRGVGPRKKPAAR